MSHDGKPKSNPIRSAPDGVDLLGQSGERFVNFNEQNERNRTYQTTNQLRTYLQNRGGGRGEETSAS